MRCITSRGAVPVRKVERDHLDAGEQLSKRVDRRRARAIADPDEQRPLVEPDRVAALDRRRQLDPPDDRHACPLERRDGRLGLAPPSFLPGEQQHGAVDARRASGRTCRSRRGCPASCSETTTSAPASSSSAQNASCSACAAATSGAARQPYAPQAPASSASGRRTSTRRRSPHIDALPYPATARQATRLRSRGLRPSSSTARSASTQSIPIAIRVSLVALPRCGVSTTFSSSSSPSSTSGSRSKTSSAAPAITPARSASTSARSSTIGPRAVFTSTAVGRIAASAGGVDQVPCPVGERHMEADDVRLGEQAREGRRPRPANRAVAPNASASRAVSRPIRPGPTISTLLPVEARRRA